jgi:hypothetical protein
MIAMICCNSHRRTGAATAATSAAATTRNEQPKRRENENHEKAPTNNDDRVFGSEISGAARTTTRAAHAAPAAMVAEATRGVETRARKRKRDLDAQAGVAFPGLPFDVAVSLVEKTPARSRGPRGASRGEQRHARRGGRDRAEGGGVRETMPPSADT